LTDGAWKLVAEMKWLRINKGKRTWKIKQYFLNLFTRIHLCPFILVIKMPNLIFREGCRMVWRRNGQFRWPFPPILLLAFLSLSNFISISIAENQGQFLLITDFHVDQKYDRYGNKSKMCHRDQSRENETPKGNGKGQTELGQFGDRNCDSPPVGKEKGNKIRNIILGISGIYVERGETTNPKTRLHNLDRGQCGTF
jgi:hypothetical protein